MVEKKAPHAHNPGTLGPPPPPPFSLSLSHSLYRSLAISLSLSLYRSRSLSLSGTFFDALTPFVAVGKLLRADALDALVVPCVTWYADPVVVSEAVLLEIDGFVTRPARPAQCGTVPAHVMDSVKVDVAPLAPIASNTASRGIGRGEPCAALYFTPAVQRTFAVPARVGHRYILTAPTVEHVAACTEPAPAHILPDIAHLASRVVQAGLVDARATPRLVAICSAHPDPGRVIVCRHLLIFPASSTVRHACGGERIPDGVKRELVGVAYEAAARC